LCIREPTQVSGRLTTNVGSRLSRSSGLSPMNEPVPGSDPIQTLSEHAANGLLTPTILSRGRSGEPRQPARPSSSGRPSTLCGCMYTAVRCLTISPCLRNVVSYSRRNPGRAPGTWPPAVDWLQRRRALAGRPCSPRAQELFLPAPTRIFSNLLTAALRARLRASFSFPFPHVEGPDLGRGTGNRTPSTVGPMFSVMPRHALEKEMSADGIARAEHPPRRSFAPRMVLQARESSWSRRLDGWRAVAMLADLARAHPLPAHSRPPISPLDGAALVHPGGPGHPTLRRRGTVTLPNSFSLTKAFPFWGDNPRRVPRAASGSSTRRRSLCESGALVAETSAAVT